MLLISNTFNVALPLLPSIAKTVVLDPIGIGIESGAVSHQIPTIFNKQKLLALPQTTKTFRAPVLFRMLSQLPRVKCFITHHQDIRIVFFLKGYKLSEVHRSSYTHRIRKVYIHSIQVTKVRYPTHVLDSRSICKKAHSLKPSETPCLINRQHNLVLHKPIEYRTE